MSSPAPSLAQITAQIAAIREKDTSTRVFGFHSPGPWQGAPSLVVGAECLKVAACQSALEIREAMLSVEADDGAIVILTPLLDENLEGDVRARLARGRLLTVRTWDVVREALKLRDIDPRLRDEAWMAERLLEAIAGGPSVVVPSGFLDADTAWDLVATSLGLPSGRPDLLELLRWADDDGLARYVQAGEAVQAALRRRVRETAGAGGEAVLACLSGGSGADVVALGLVCGVVFAMNAPASARINLERAAVRLERYCGQRAVSPAAGQAWASAAETLTEDLLENQGGAAARPLLQRADALLREVEAHEQASLARFSPLGFEQRLASFAEAISDAVGRVPLAVTPEALEALRTVSCHGLARTHSERVERCEMAVRLLRWLARTAGSSDAGSFEDAAIRYASDTGFADWVRGTLEAGDGCEPLSAAYRGLLGRVVERREHENERFGRLLAEWVSAGGSLRQALPIEDVLSRLLAPLAAHTPVLLLVVDGMSVAVYREIVEDVVREGWIELIPESGNAPRAAVAALPTVTEVCRASLLSGRLCRGAAADEKAAFESHPDLMRVAGRKRPPVLFHKPDLGEGGQAGLSTSVRAALADPDRRIVSVVVNAVDDHLAKGDQIRPRWGVEAIGPLRNILHAAQEGGRIVVLTSDHGHVPERGTEAHPFPDGERWRTAADRSAEAGEVVVAGARVVAPSSRKLIVPWTERLRYGVKKNGYHGGVSPQEVVVPIGVFGAGLEIPGWREVGEAWPAWWSEDAVAGPSAPRKGARRKARAPETQGALFPVPTVVAPSAGWVGALLHSAAWKAQIQMAGRVTSETERFRLALEAFEERGGTLTRRALGYRLGLPPVRVPGFVSALRRVLNVDGYEVLEVDDDTLTLNRELLRKQFELP